MEKSEAQKLLGIVRRNYQEIAAQFDATRKKEIWPEIRKYAEKVEPGFRVLDLGCGNGRFLEALAGKNIEYLGVDNSPELIRLAKINYPDRNFNVGDILDLGEIRNDYYDIIFCLAVLQHIPGRELRVEALKRMVSKLKPGGELIMSNWNLWHNKKYRRQLIKNYFLKLLGREKLDYNDLIFPWKNERGEALSDRYYHAFTKKELKKLVRLSGLKLSVLKHDNYNFWLVARR